MVTGRIVYCLVAGVVCVTAFAVPGCSGGYTSETRIGGRPVVYKSSAGREASIKVVSQDAATLEVGRLRFTIDRTHVRWGEDRSLALPADWKRVEFIDEGSHVGVRVDGAQVGEIRPAA